MYLNVFPPFIRRGTISRLLPWAISSFPEKWLNLKYISLSTEQFFFFNSRSLLKRGKNKKKWQNCFAWKRTSWSYAFFFIQGCSFTHSGTTGVLTSPDYPSKYSGDSDCTYRISGITGKGIILTFSAFDVEKSLNCGFDYLEVSILSVSYFLPTIYFSQMFGVKWHRKKLQTEKYTRLSRSTCVTTLQRSNNFGAKNNGLYGSV